MHRNVFARRLMATAAVIANIAWINPVAAQSAPASTTADDEEIVITGIRASLEDALAIRRASDVILDGISADDVGSTPDLNLGEALQRIPGVQINRSDERRNASISVRGLPGNLSKTTVQGQNVADSNLAGGNGNPFGIFDASIFGGANVIKSMSADLPAGGLASNIDLRIRGALSRKNSFVLRAELGYEETTEDVLPGYFGSFSHKFSNSFGIYAVASYRKESFRRDSININGYGNTYTDARVASFGLPAPSNAGGKQIVLYPGDLRQFILANEGDRLSAGAGMEWEISDGLSLRVDGIYTRRNLDGAINDIFSINASDTQGEVNPTLKADGTADIRLLGQDDRDGDGILDDIYVAPSFTIIDPIVSAGNRVRGAKNSAWAVYPQLDFKNDDWHINLTGTISKAKAVDNESQFNMDIRRTTNRNNGNGVEVDFSTGFGNVNDYSSVLRIPSDAFFFGAQSSWTVSTNGIQAFTRRTVSGVQLENRITVTGTDRLVSRDLWSLDGQIERFLDFGPLTSIKIGGRYDDEKARRDEYRNAIYGLALGNLDQSIIQLNEAVTSGGKFFGGQVPGVNLDNFLSVNLDRIFELTRPTRDALIAPGQPNPPRVVNQTGGAFGVTSATTIPNLPVNPLSGLYHIPDARFVGNNFNSDRTNTELFGMARFNFKDFGNLPIRGNVGLRYIKTKLNGITDVDKTAGNPAATGDYSAWLPSANLIFDLHKDIVARAAYYKTFEARDLVEFAPAATVGTFSVNEDTGFESYVINFSTIDLQPRRSEAFDFGISWYNRPGGVFSVGYFHKKVNAITVRQQVCPESVTAPINGTDTTLSPLFVDSNEICRLQQNSPVEEENARVRINQSFNLAESVPINGIEAQIQQRLDFLPGFLGNMGAIVNFTRIWTGEVQGQRFFNVADYTYNLIGYYEDEFLQARVAYNYASEYELTSTSTFSRGDRTVRGRGQLDFSGAIRPSKNLELRVEAFNITNSRREEYEVYSELNRRSDYDGRTYSISLQYKF